MLNIRISECPSCGNVIDLICRIDKKLTYYTKNQYNNISLLLDLDWDEYTVKRLLRYKSILKHRLYNPSYVCEVPMSAIVSKIKILINK